MSGFTMDLMNLVTALPADRIGMQCTKVNTYKVWHQIFQVSLSLSEL